MSAQRTPAQKLRLIAGRYLADAHALAHARDLGARRKASIPQIQQILRPFIEDQAPLAAMRPELDRFLRRPEHATWGTDGFWMMTLNQLSNYHGAAGEQQLRETLDGLSHANAGQRFEEFGRFLQAQNQQLTLGRRGAAPGRSPFLITLFARWLDSEQDVIVAWPSLREGLKDLHDHGALPHSAGLHFTHEARIADAADYAAVEEAIAGIAAAAPALADSSDYWHERFLAWVHQHRQSLPLWIEGEEPMQFADEPLAPIKPAALRERIAELRRELLIDAATIERVYQALVLGQHIILSGPPGTGKTRLAQLLPRLLWMSEEPAGAAPSFTTLTGSHISHELTTASSYAVHVATATDEWTPRHVIGGIVPAVDENSGAVRYEVAPGCLTATILRNWDADPQEPASWAEPGRRRVRERWEGRDEDYRGLWLVIDEFNRAPIDLALGEALTAIGGSHATLTVPTRIGPSPLRLPRDFRIIGTLNTFDRHFLNQMSEALKRRFVFVEVLPPGRPQREAEQATVLRAALGRLPQVGWMDLGAVLKVSAGAQDAPWRRQWQGDSAVKRLFEEGWRLFEVIRVFRQFGTAQAIAWATAFLGGGLLKELKADDDDGWRGSLSNAFADTLADQLQILFPDEIEALLAYVQTKDAAGFAAEYHDLLGRLISPKRRSAQMLALQSVKNDQGQPLISRQEAQAIVRDEAAQVPAAALGSLFHADAPRGPLPEFAERLERFLFERMI